MLMCLLSAKCIVVTTTSSISSLNTPPLYPMGTSSANTTRIGFFFS
jgi:hypothetical protein